MRISISDIPTICWDDKKEKTPNCNTLVEEKKSEYFDTIHWSWKSWKQENFDDCSIVMSHSHKYFNKTLGKDMFSYRFIGYNDWNEALKFIETKKCIYEDFLICKPYIDLEYYVEKEEYLAKEAKYQQNAKESILIMHTYIREAMIKILDDNNYKDKKFNILTTQSHGFAMHQGKLQFKFSFHFVVNCTYRFRNTNDARQLADAIRNASQNTEITKCIDMSVYKLLTTATQKFRCVYSRV